MPDMYVCVYDTNAGGILQLMFDADCIAGTYRSISLQQLLVSRHPCRLLAKDEAQRHVYCAVGMSKCGVNVAAYLDQ